MTALSKANKKLLALAHIKANYHDFLIAKGRELSQKIILDEVLQRMINAGFSKKIWENTKISRVEIKEGKLKIHFKSTYFSETGFDVALAREVGTRRHWIEPKKTASVIVKGNKQYPTHYYQSTTTKQALSWIQDGVRLFSKGHYVNGIKSLHIIRDTLKEKTPVLQNALNGAAVKWAQVILKS